MEALLNYFKKATEKPAALKKDGKRERTTTERAKESKEQDLEMSPKKRKKIQKENEKEEKNHEGSESTSEGKKKEPSKEGKKRKNEKEDLKKISEMNPKEKEKKKRGLKAMWNYWLPKRYWHLLCAANLMTFRLTADLLQCRLMETPL